MGRRLLTAWESMPPRRQVLVGAPTMFVLLLVVHLVGFPHLTFARSCAYAIMEAVPLALVVTYATQVELVRRENATGDAEPGAQQSHPADIGIDGDIAPDPAPTTPGAPNSGAGQGIE
ncbi:MAG: hypothetical protein JWN72_1318 [Thermoleophilia bacterium]|nr:hypothetical protein [Thermoleophilia bacterium]